MRSCRLQDTQPRMLHLVLLMLLAGVCSSQQLQSPEQQAACEQISSSGQDKSEPVGTLTITGCPLTFRQRMSGNTRSSSRSEFKQPLLLEPSACVTLDDLLAASRANPLAFNYMRNQVFFPLAIQLHSPAMLVANNVSATVMQPTDVDVVLKYQPANFSVANARLLPISSEGGAIAAVNVYCDEHAYCRELQGRILREHQYFLEILELRLTATVVPGCPKTVVTISKKVSLITKKREISTVFDNGCSDKDNNTSSAFEDAPLILTKFAARFTGRGRGLAFFNLRVSCRNMFPPVSTAAAFDTPDVASITGKGATRLLPHYGVRLSEGQDLAIAPQIRHRTTVSNLLSIYVQYRLVDSRPGLSQRLLSLTYGVDRTCSELSVRREGGRVAVTWQSRTLLSGPYDQPCSLAARDPACSLTLLVDILQPLRPPRILLDRTPAPLTEASASSGADGGTGDEGGCREFNFGTPWRLRIGGFKGDVTCAAAAWAGDREVTSKDAFLLYIACGYQLMRD